MTPCSGVGCYLCLYSEDGSGRFLRHIGSHLPVCTMSTQKTTSTQQIGECDRFHVWTSELCVKVMKFVLDLFRLCTHARTHTPVCSVGGWVLHQEPDGLRPLDAVGYTLVEPLRPLPSFSFILIFSLSLFHFLLISLPTLFSYAHVLVVFLSPFFVSEHSNYCFYSSILFFIFSS
jgi:hypothetical protein